MKKLICVKEVKTFAEQGKTTVKINTDTIITPAAQDAAKELGITFVAASDKKELSMTGDINYPEVDSDLIYQVLKAMMDRGMLGDILSKLSCLPCKSEKDSSGLMLMHEDSVQYEQDGQAFSREVFQQENQGRKAGYFKMEHTSLTQESEHDEIILVLSGEVEISINGNKYIAKQEDMLYVPKHTKAAWEAKNSVKMFYIAFES